MVEKFGMEEETNGTTFYLPKTVFRFLKKNFKRRLRNSSAATCRRLPQPFVS